MRHPRNEVSLDAALADPSSTKCWVVCYFPESREIEKCFMNYFAESAEVMP